MSHLDITPFLLQSAFREITLLREQINVLQSQLSTAQSPIIVIYNGSVQQDQIQQQQLAIQQSNQQPHGTQQLHDDQQQCHQPVRPLIGYFEASRTTQFRFREELRNDFRAINIKLHQRGLTFRNVTASDRANSEFEHDVKIEVHQVNTVQPTDEHNAFIVKDTENISDRKYHRVRGCTIGWPTLHRARLFRHQIANMFPVQRNEVGVYNGARNKIEHMANIHKQQIKMVNNKLNIKLSADGANVGRKLKFLNLTFSFLEQENSSGFVDANYTIGIYEIVKEDYVSVRRCFTEVMGDMSRLKSIFFYQMECELSFFFAGDYKMLACVMGVNAANSIQPCVHCICPVNEFHNTKKIWSITDPNLGARTAYSAFESIGQNGQIEAPMVDFIPFCNFVPDLLHMNLRICDVLFEKVFSDIVKLDWMNKTQNNKLFLNFLVEKLRIFKPVYEVNKKYILKSFSRDENLKILSAMPLAKLFPQLPKVDLIQKNWRDFYSICVALIRNSWTSDKIRVTTDEWLDVLCHKIYSRDFATVYMHELQQHMHQYKELHGNLNRFSCQRLEKKNHSNARNLFQSTNLHTNLTEKDDCLVQLLNKNNRIDFLERFEESTSSQKVFTVNRRRQNFIANFRAKQLY